MPQVSKPGADFSLTIDSVEYPFILAEDENGAKQWNDGLAPMLSAQIRTTGFGYEHIPPEIEVLEAFESYDGGAGVEVAPEDSRIHYNYSQGIDASWEDKLIVSLKQNTILESDGSAIAAAPTKFYHSPDGFFMIAGAYIYEWDLTTTAWVQRDDASADGVSYTDFAELDGTNYAARGSTVDYKYSTDGVTWTAFTDADENADVFAVRGNASDVAALWKVKVNIIQTSTNGANSGVAWAGSDEVGGTSETVHSMIAVDNTLYVFKKEGFYSYDGTNTQDIWKTQYLTDTNGKNAYLHTNGKIYVPYGHRLLEYDPYGDTALTPVYPPDQFGASFDSLELRGDITAVGGNETHLYLAIKNRAGNTYIMKGHRHAHADSRTAWDWHSILYLGANDCNTLAVVGPTILHATNPALVYGYGTGTRYVVLPRESMHPTDDPICRFDTTEGVMYGAYVDFGAKTFPKFLNRGLLLGYNVTAGRYATMKYEIERDGTETTLVSAVSNGITEANTSSEVEFQLIRPILYMATGDEAASPTVDAFTLAATLNPRRKRMWRPVIALSDGLEFREGSNTQNIPSVDTLRRVLFGAVNKRVTLTDRANLDYTVRLLDIQPASLVDKRIGGKETDALMYQLTLVEITALTSDATVAIYDESAYDGGHVYG